MELLETSGSGVLDLNKAATTLGVQKRRIYDITNVLEGIGLIEKKSKNNILWKGGSLFSKKENAKAAIPLQDLPLKILQKQKEEIELDQKLKHVQMELKEINDNSSQLIYVEYDDIRKLPSMDDQTIIAVRAVHGTTLEVPEPDSYGTEQRKYEIFLRSDDPIDVYVISDQACDEQMFSQSQFYNEMSNQNLIELPNMEYMFTGDGISDYLASPVRSRKMERF